MLQLILEIEVFIILKKIYVYVPQRCFTQKPLGTLRISNGNLNHF